MSSDGFQDRLQAALDHAEMKPLHLDRALDEAGYGQTAGYTSRILRGERAQIQYDRVAAWADALGQRCREVGKVPVSFEWLCTGRGEMLAPPVDPLEAAIAYLGDRLSPRAVDAVRAEASDPSRSAEEWGQALVEAQRQVTDGKPVKVSATPGPTGHSHVAQPSLGKAAEMCTAHPRALEQARWVAGHLWVELNLGQWETHLTGYQEAHAPDLAKLDGEAEAPDSSGVRAKGKKRSKKTG